MLRLFVRYNKNLNAYKTREGDAGYDMYATHTTILFPLIPTRIKLNMSMEFKPNEFGLVTSRSGQSAKGNFVIPGIIDSIYRGQLNAIMVRLSLFPKIIRKGERVAQLLLLPYIKPSLIEVDNIDINTERGEKGFQSTGAM